jgi:FkbH-like protein
MKDFNALKKNLKQPVDGLPTTRLALLGDSATQFVAQAIRGAGIDIGLNINVFEADFNQIDRQILDPQSEYYQFKPEITVVFYSSHKLLQKFNRAPVEERSRFADMQITHFQNLAAAISKGANSKIIFCNFTEEDDRVFGQFANSVQQSFPFQLRRLNFLLAETAASGGGFFICDLCTIQSTIGRDMFWSPTVYVNTEMTVSIEALPLVAQSVVQIVQAMRGNIKKCLIADLDNTLWGDVVAEVGTENIQLGQLGVGKAFTELQWYLKKLQQRGVILCVCSKNDENVAKEPFERHPDMVLRLDDIAVFVANWQNKADNIRHIQRVLNIGFDSMVFIDDNPFERNMVRENLPQVCVPEMPDDPALYLDFLYSLNLFETVSFSNEDSQRTEQYRREAMRTEFQETFASEDDFLRSLDMRSDARPFDSFTIPRVAQLSQRSNQFNLRTVRYTDDDVRRIASSPDFFTLSFSLADRFGDNGLVAAVILHRQDSTTLFIDTWFMSCRVLKRGMENFTLNQIVALARENGYSQLVGEYLPTAKNSMVKDHYERLGFTPDGENRWRLDVSNYDTKSTFITKND